MVGRVLCARSMSGFSAVSAFSDAARVSEDRTGCVPCVSSVFRADHQSTLDTLTAPGDENPWKPRHACN